MRLLRQLKIDFDDYFLVGRMTDVNSLIQQDYKVPFKFDEDILRLKV